MLRLGIFCEAGLEGSSKFIHVYLIYVILSLCEACKNLSLHEACEKHMLVRSCAIRLPAVLNAVWGSGTRARTVHAANLYRSRGEDVMLKRWQNSHDKLSDAKTSGPKRIAFPSELENQILGGIPSSGALFSEAMEATWSRMTGQG